MTTLKQDAANLNSSMETANEMLVHEQEQVAQTTILFNNIKDSVSGVIEVQKAIASFVDDCNETADTIQMDVESAKESYIGVADNVNALSKDITKKNLIYEDMANIIDQLDPIVDEIKSNNK